MDTAIDYYEILGIDPRATKDEIRRAYRELAAMWHPDRIGDFPEAHDRMILINEAYRVLSDAELREAYDRAHANFVSTDDADTADDEPSTPFLVPDIVDFGEIEEGTSSGPIIVIVKALNSWPTELIDLMPRHGSFWYLAATRREDPDEVVRYEFLADIPLGFLADFPPDDKLEVREDHAFVSFGDVSASITFRVKVRRSATSARSVGSPVGDPISGSARGARTVDPGSWPTAGIAATIRARAKSSFGGTLIGKLAIVIMALAFLAAPFGIMYVMLGDHTSGSIHGLGQGLISLVCFAWFVLGLWAVWSALTL